MRNTRPTAEITGETVARAKRTDRAEARRRYRAEVAGTEGLDEDTADGEGNPAAAPATGRTRASSARTTAPSERLGIAAAFRQSIHPLTWRADLALLPSLVRTKAFLIPIGLSGVTAIVFAVAPTQITYLFMQYFIWAPPIGAVFLAGFLAPRASWLIGLLVGAAASVFFAVLLVSGLFNTSMGVMGAAPIPTDQYLAYIGQWLALSSLMGALFAAGAAWYRRFLQLSNPNRGRRPDPKRGGGGGRSRSSGTARTR